MPEFQIKTGETKEQYRERLTAELKVEAEAKRSQFISGEIKVVMDIDDFGFLLPGYDDLLRLKESLPNLKITCFTIPMDKAFFNSVNARHFKWESYKRWARFVNESDWIEIAFHGFAHVHNECDISYDKAEILLKASENLFKHVELEYVKIIKAPYWQMSYDFLMACKDNGYVVAIDRNHPRPVPSGLETYIYNWSFEEPIPNTKVIKGHGHFIGENKNNLSDTLHNILVQLPKETQFMFMSEHIKYEKENNKEGRESREVIGEGRASIPTITGY